MENRGVFTCKKSFLVLLSTVFSEKQFFVWGCYFKNQCFTELQGPVFTKETLKNQQTNKQL